MNAEEMKLRTKKFAIAVGYLVIELDKNDLNRNYSNQLIRCSSSVAANYRAARRAKSNADFVNKLKIVEEELDEAYSFWNYYMSFNQSKREKIKVIHAEGEELLKIIVATINSSRK
jgi:four helix bundle protein